MKAIVKTIVLAILLTSVSCQQPNNKPILEESFFKVVSLKGEKIDIAEVSMLFFPEKGRVSGKGGCNRYNAKLQLKENTMSINKVASTRMFCEEGSTVEDQFFKLLEKVKNYRYDGDTLTLMNEEEETLITAKKS